MIDLHLKNACQLSPSPIYHPAKGKHLETGPNVRGNLIP